MFRRGGALAIVIFLWGTLPVVAADSPDIRLTTTQDKDGVFHTRGEVSLPYSTAIVDRAMTNMDDYNVWAPRWQDGRDPESAKEIFQLTGTKPHNAFLDLIYRIKLVWPFGSEGNIITLKTQFPVPDQGAVRRIIFTQKNASIAVDRLEGDFYLFREGNGSLVRLDCQVRLAWFLRPFFPLSFYEHYIVNRIRTALKSFALYASGTSGADTNS